MGEPNFFKRERGLTLKEIAGLTGCEAPVQRGGDLVVGNVAALKFAGPNDITFADRPADAAAVAVTQAAACLVTVELVRVLPETTIAFVSPDPYRAFLQVANALYPTALRPSSLFDGQARAGGAVIHPSARLEPNVTIDPGAMIGPRAEIGSGTLIAPMAVIGPDVRIGRDCAIGSGASVMNALI